MKKIVVMLAVTAFGMNASAQESKPAEPQKAAPVQSDRQASYDAAMMKGGKVWLMKGDKSTLCEKESKIGSSIVHSDGLVVLNDGSKSNLKEGDKVSADGSIVRAATGKADIHPDKQPADKQ